MESRRARSLTVAGALAAAAVVGSWLAAQSGAQEGGGTQREFMVQARKYAFAPDTIEVQQDDLVRITLHAEDIAHSFTVDDYRIAKRAAAGQAVTFEFRADRPGTFPFYCNLKIDEGCRNMRGQFVVRPR